MIFIELAKTMSFLAYDSIIVTPLAKMSCEHIRYSTPANRSIYKYLRLLKAGQTPNSDGINIPDHKVVPGWG